MTETRKQKTLSLEAKREPKFQTFSYSAEARSNSYKPVENDANDVELYRYNIATKSETRSIVKSRKRTQNSQVQVTTVATEKRSKHIEEESLHVLNVFNDSLAMMHETWRELLQKQFLLEYFRELLGFLYSHYISLKKTIYPQLDMVFRSFVKCPWDRVKVVILGQDPYHQPGQATGLAFDVPRNTPKKQLPPTLKNIIKELHADQDHKLEETATNLNSDLGLLEHWAHQGVLLLNTVLTVEDSKPLSHRNHGWEKFTDYIFNELITRREHLVFLLWGKPAHDKLEMIVKSETRNINIHDQQTTNVDYLSKHCFIKTSHPSPLSALRTDAPFLGSNCFKRTNGYLVANGHTPINWSI